MDMLRLYNTLTRKKEPFTPRTGKTVSLYTCGPTVYNFAHIGNLRTYIFEDVLKRTLLANAFRVNHVMNITDVGHLTDDADQGEDKMELGAAREKRSVWSLAEFYTTAFQEDLARLRIFPPSTWCKATDHITEQLKLIQTLEKKGFTYTLADGVYFDTSKFPRYGAMARLDLDGLKAGARVEVVAGKRHSTDFALWKLSGTHKRQMEWPSPWGVGFPGWAIECSAMSMKYLKLPIDIHCGGIDHIPVHHTNEIAQSEAATGKQFVRFWMHGAFMTIRASKMAKSQGNFLTLTKLMEEGFDPLAFRLLTYTAHYRTTMDFSVEALRATQQSYDHLKNAIRERLEQNDGVRTTSQKPTKIQQAFDDAMNDDLNVPEAMASVWATLKTPMPTHELTHLLKRFDAVLGLGLLEGPNDTGTIHSDTQQLLAERESARTNKEWKRADQLRTRIEEAGFVIEDTPRGARLRKR